MFSHISFSLSNNIIKLHFTNKGSNAQGAYDLSQLHSSQMSEPDLIPCSSPLLEVTLPVPVREPHQCGYQENVEWGWGDRGKGIQHYKLPTIEWKWSLLP